MRRLPLPLVLCLLASLTLSATLSPVFAAKPKSGAKTSAKTSAKTPEHKLNSDVVSGLAFRGVGPALMSGRINDIAIPPGQPNTWYVVAASGGVWKTENAGTTWSPIFDGEGSYSIGCIAIDPQRPLTVWVGTGENNSQRSVGYGDGLYKSLDGGRKWDKVGLETSEHIGEILIDPRQPDVVYVAAQGPLWNEGGERGLYKTTDGGATWSCVLAIDERTGVSDLAFDPTNPDVIYATAYQRHRRVWTLIDGGPGSAIYKSVDAGKSWKKLTNGLPKEDMGRIGICVSPAAPLTVYAIIEAANAAGGFYRSRDGGANWEKRGDYVSTSPQYYQELVPDPKNPDRVYSMDTYLRVTHDGGKTWARAGEQYKHVDNHAMWIEPENTDHALVGCDGGVYETWDRCATWKYVANLPITQFYKLCVDNATPFYNIYGGTQDNNTQGGPARTRTTHGIRNSDWFITVGGDGFQPRVDPTDPNIVYSQSQHGELIRFDRRSGDQLDIQPQEEPADDPLRWNWDSPLIISPHAHTRLYFGAQRLFRSDDRGDTWRPVSGDLTRRVDRNRFKVAGRVWSVDAVAKNASTSFYGNLVALAESPRVDGLLYTGSDDGRVAVSEDGGGHWRTIDRFPGVPDLSYVSRLEASSHDASVVYAAFDNHKSGDYKPYVLRSGDRGKSWKSIAGDLPARGTVYALAEDPVNPRLLFVGTEFGVFASVDSGTHWFQLKGGLPTIAVRDLAIQAREGDLVLGTFGRGFYVLDDYAPLRSLSVPAVDSAARLLPVRPALMYVPSSPLGGRGPAQQGHAYYTAPNPPFGAVFTYYLRDELKTRKKVRQGVEQEAAKKGGDVFYPSWDSLRSESREEAPSITLTVTDVDGRVVRRLSGPTTKGFQRVAWDLRYPTPDPTQLAPPAERNTWDTDPAGPLAAPGRYRVSLEQRVDGVTTTLAGPVSFECVTLEDGTLPAPDRAVVLAFQQKTARLQRAVLGSIAAGRESQQRVKYLQKALEDTPNAAPRLGDEVRALDRELSDLFVSLTGDELLRRKNEPTPPSLSERVNNVVEGSWTSTSKVTRTHQRDYEIAAQQFSALRPRLASAQTTLERIEREADAAGSPWTPGRGMPEWSPE